MIQLHLSTNIANTIPTANITINKRFRCIQSKKKMIFGKKIIVLPEYVTKQIFYRNITLEIII